MSEPLGPTQAPRSGAWLYVVALAVLALDQFTKALIVLRLNVGDSAAILGPVLSFTRRTNAGGAFSVLQDCPAALIAVSAVILALVLIAGPQIAGRSRGALIALGLVAGGAAGNLLDRVRLGHVVDFIDFHFWPVFNVADIGITVGAGLLLITLILLERSQGGNEGCAQS